MWFKKNPNTTHIIVKQHWRKFGFVEMLAMFLECCKKLTTMVVLLTGLYRRYLWTLWQYPFVFSIEGRQFSWMHLQNPCEPTFYHDGSHEIERKHPIANLSSWNINSGCQVLLSIPISGIAPYLCCKSTQTNVMENGMSTKPEIQSTH